MKQLFSILILVIAIVSCQKEEIDLRNDYIGNWDFEVTYTSEVNNQVRESIFNCQGVIKKDNNLNFLQLHYCLNDYLNIIVNEEGVVYTAENKLLGVIEPQTCLIVDNNPLEESISKITIEGNR